MFVAKYEKVISYLDVALASAYRKALLEEFTWWVGFRVTLWGTSQ